jgi:hypothetical protein
MNFNRPRHSEDLMFVIVLLLPAVFAGTRYVGFVREVAHIAQARSAATSTATYPGAFVS